MRPAAPQVTVVRYQVAWPAHFRLAAEELTVAIQNLPVQLEHIGSTSVVGLCAKPVIDILLGVEDLAVLERRIPIIEALGYVYRPAYETQLPERRYFVRAPTSMPKVHLHALIAGSPLWRRHLAFRNALRADPDLAHQYAALKFELAAQHAHDKSAYTVAKAPFIQRVLARLPLPHD